MIFVETNLRTKLLYRLKFILLIVVPGCKTGLLLWRESMYFRYLKTKC